MERIGPYLIQGEIGRGGAGVVYRARDPNLKRDVAIKVVLGTWPSRLERFRREAESLARLQHPHIVRVLSFGDRGGTPYLVMDLVQGGSLYDRLRQHGPLPPREAASIVERLAGALQHAHDHGVLHRDLKPQNVLLTPDGHPLLTDFGLARELDVSQGPTQSGAMVGTPGYLPPEQVFGGQLKIGPTADVYGLGATLYALLTGVPPLPADDLQVFLASLATQAPVPPRDLRPEVDRALEAICLRCLAKRPADRFPSAQALGAELAAYLAGESTQTAGDRRQRRLLLGLSTAALLSVGVLAGALALPRSSSQAEAAAAVPASSETPPPSASQADTDGDPLADPNDDEEEWEDDGGGWDDTGDSEGGFDTAEEALDQVNEQLGGQIPEGTTEQVEAAGGGNLLEMFKAAAPALSQHLKKENLIDEADDALDKDDDPQRAVELYTQAAEIGVDADLLAKRARAQVCAWRWEAALADAEAATSLPGGDSDYRVYRFRGVALIALGRFEEALRALERSLELKGNSYVTRWELNRAQLALGRLEDPLPRLRGFFEDRRTQTHGTMLLALAYLRAGDLASTQQLCEQTLRSARESGERYASFWEGWLAPVQAGLARRRGNLDEAVSLLARAAASFEPFRRSGTISWPHPEVVRLMRAEAEALLEQLPTGEARSTAGDALERVRELEAQLHLPLLDNDAR